MRKPLNELNWRERLRLKWHVLVRRYVTLEPPVGVTIPCPQCLTPVEEIGICLRHDHTTLSPCEHRISNEHMAKLMARHGASDE